MAASKAASSSNSLGRPFFGRRASIVQFYTMQFRKSESGGSHHTSEPCGTKVTAELEKSHVRQIRREDRTGDGRQQRNRAGDGTGIRERGRVRLHNGAAAGRARQGGTSHRHPREGGTGGLLESRRPRPLVRAD